MSKEGVHYLQRILATRKTLSEEEQERLNRAMEVLLEEPKVEMSVQQGAELINERIGAEMEGDTLLKCLQFGANPEDPSNLVYEDFYELVRSLPHNVKNAANRAFWACRKADIDTVGEVRSKGKTELLGIYGIGDVSVGFLMTAFKRREPQGQLVDKTKSLSR